MESAADSMESRTSRVELESVVDTTAADTTQKGQ